MNNDIVLGLVCGILIGYALGIFIICMISIGKK